MTAIFAVGSARVASGSKPGPAIAYSPAPYALRTITQIFGTVASETALIIFAPCRMMPSFSTAVPTMKPGTSARNSSGTLNASQVWMNRVHGRHGQPREPDGQLARPQLVDLEERPRV